MSEFGCAVALVANVAFTQDPQTTITPETIRAVRGNFNSNGAIYWALPLSQWHIKHTNNPKHNLRGDRTRGDQEFPNTFAERFEELMSHPTPKYYVAIRIFVRGEAGYMPEDDITGQHWVGASELVPRVDPRYVIISPTSRNDWDMGGAVTLRDNNRGVRGWRVENGNIYVPLSEVVGYRIFSLP
jgi:hypothetical protein